MKTVTWCSDNVYKMLIQRWCHGRHQGRHSWDFRECMDFFGWEMVIRSYYCNSNILIGLRGCPHGFEFSCIIVPWMNVCECGDRVWVQIIGFFVGNSHYLKVGFIRFCIMSKWSYDRVPAKVDFINIEGLGRTKDDYVRRFINELFQATNFSEVSVCSWVLSLQGYLYLWYGCCGIWVKC